MATRQLRSLPMPSALTRPVLWRGTRLEYVLLEAVVAVGPLIVTRFSLVAVAFLVFVVLIVHPLLVAATKWDADFLHVVAGHFELHSSLGELLRGSPRAFFFPARADWATPHPVVRSTGG